MHMVTETYQLRDGEKLTEFYNGIDWESLFEFVRHYYSIGVEQMPTTCLKPNGRIEVNWPENLRDKCGLFGHTYREVYLQTFSSCCFHDITYDKDIVDKYLARPDFYRLNISWKRLQRHFFGCLFAADIFAEIHRIFRRVQLRKPVQC